MKPETEIQIRIDLWEHEGCVPWLYCDKKGLPTIGVGNLIPSIKAAQRFPLFHLVTAKAATDGEKSQAWAVVADAFREDLGAIAYRGCSDLRISKEYAQALLRERLAGEFLPALRSLFHSFDAWPTSAQRACVDMIYSLGVHGMDGISRYPKFVAACQAGDWKRAAAECVRVSGKVKPTDADPEGLGKRNLWTRRMLLDAARAALPTLAA